MSLKIKGHLPFATAIKNVAMIGVVGDFALMAYATHAILKTSMENCVAVQINSV